MYKIQLTVIQISGIKKADCIIKESSRLKSIQKPKL